MPIQGNHQTVDKIRGPEAPSGPLLIDSRAVNVDAPPGRAFEPIRRIGGTTGWYYANWLWQLRGVVDRLFGGVGLRRKGRNSEHLHVGDEVDCWRVEACEPDRLLRLAFEMRIPGRAWLQFEVHGDTTYSTIRQTAVYEPGGLAGRIYWFCAYRLHRLVFAGMLRGIAARCGPLAAKEREPF